MSDTSSLNDQVRDSLDQVQQTMEGMQQPFAVAATFNTISHALSLALQNAVARQQHSHMLRSAMTAAATQALLEGRTDQAEAVLKLANSPLVNPSLQSEVALIQTSISELREELEKIMSVTPAKAGTTT